MQSLNIAIDNLMYSFAYVLIAASVVDNASILLVYSRRWYIDNRYVKLHKRYGVIKCTLAKIILAAYICHLLFLPIANGIDLILPIIVYCVYVTKMLVDILQFRSPE